MKNLLKFLQEKALLLLAVMVSAVVGGASTAVVLAAIPDASGVIHGCRLNATGTLRVIDSASQNCNGLETAVNWQQSAGVEVYSNKVDFTVASADPQTIINIPEFGSFTVDPDVCQTGQFWGSVLDYENTGTMDLTPILYSGGSSSMDPILDGATWEFAMNPDAHQTTITLHSGNGPTARSAIIHFGAWYQDSEEANDSCSYTAMAIVK